MRPGGEVRGNAQDRRQRKEWLLSGVFGGDGRSVPCTWCGEWLGYRTVEADRLVSGDEGGRYVRPNVVPACRNCNVKRNQGPLEPQREILTYLLEALDGRPWAPASSRLVQQRRAIETLYDQLRGMVSWPDDYEEEEEPCPIRF